MNRFLLGSVSLLAIFVTHSATAADLGRMPVKAPPVAAPVAYSWSGFYIGGHVGGGWGESERRESPLFFAPQQVNDHNDLSGFIGGGQVGYNLQFGQWVLGVEGDGSWSRIKGTETTTSPFTPARTSTTTLEADWITMVTGRAGFAWNNWLIYAKGGWAWVDLKSNSIVQGAGLPTQTTSGSKTRDGFIVGGGIEFGLWNNFSLKAEYNFIDIGTDPFTVRVTSGPNNGQAVVQRLDSEIHLAKVGLNYRFGLGQ